MTMVAMQAGKRLIFDGDCPMCRGTIAALLAIRLLRPEQTCSSHDLQDADFDDVLAVGLRNELVALDPRTRETRRGSDGLLWIIGDNTSLCGLVWLLSLPGFRHALGHAYRVVSYNRRIISPPRHHVVCDCEPEATVGSRLSLIVPAAALSMVVAGLFGAAVFVGSGIGAASSGAVVAGAAIAVAFVTPSVAALALLSAEKGVDYIAHLAVTMLVGALCLVPATVVALVAPPTAAGGLAIVSAAAGVMVMFAMQRRRVKALQLSIAWLWAWGAVFSGAILAVLFEVVGR